MPSPGQGQAAATQLPSPCSIARTRVAKWNLFAVHTAPQTAKWTQLAVRQTDFTRLTIRGGSLVGPTADSDSEACPEARPRAWF